MDGVADADLVGRIGWVHVPVPAEGPGQVLVPIRGGTECFAAWAQEPLERGRAVIVVAVRSARSIVVTPVPQPTPWEVV